MPNDMNVTWKHLAVVISIIGIFSSLFIVGVKAIGAKADKIVVKELAACVSAKADKTEVVRVEHRVREQIQEIKKDLRQDISAVKKKVDAIYEIVLKGK